MLAQRCDLLPLDKKIDEEGKTTKKPNTESQFKDRLKIEVGSNEENKLFIFSRNTLLLCSSKIPSKTLSAAKFNLWELFAEFTPTDSSLRNSKFLVLLH